MAKEMSSFLLFAAILATGALSAGASTAARLYVFGDSTADVGNNNFLPAPAPKANFPNYGIDYPGGVPTGRFSNGFNGVDYVAKMMRMAMSPPPFLSLTNSIEMRKGVNFASAGSGILDTTGKGTITMDEQVMDFKEVVRNLSAGVGNLTANRILSKSLLFFSTGSNDLFAHFAAAGPENSTQMDRFINPTMIKFKDQLTMLYELGARKFAVISTAVIGCIPTMLTPEGNCNVGMNNLSLRFKNATRALLEDLSQTLAGFKYSFGDAYEISTYTSEHSLQLGFTVLKTACCSAYPCTPNTTVCDNRRDHVSWDGIHPTQAVYRLTAQFSFFGPPKFARPVNIKQLLHA